MNGSIISDLGEQTYREHEALSQSALKTLLDCPARFVHEQSNPRVVSAAADFGSVVHAVLLGGSYVIVEADDWRTKAAKEARETARADGMAAVLVKDHDKAEACAKAVLEHPLAGPLLTAEGGTEESMFWQRDGQEMKGRIDKVAALDRTMLVDLKTTRSADPRQFANSVLNYGYHIQQAVYLDGWRTITEEDPGFVFIVVESEPPYLTAVYSLDDALTDYGQRQYAEALSIFQRCVETGEWPGYGSLTGVTEIGAPAWLRREWDTDQ